MLSTLYRQLAPGYSLWLEASAAIADMGQIVAGEYCFYIEHNGSLSGSDKAILNEILCGKEGSDFTSLTHLQDRDGTLCVEVGPRLSFSTPWCSNTIAILHSLQLFHIIRVERTRRWALSDAKDSVVSSLYDMMTEQVYKGSLTTLSCDSQELQQHTVINVIEDGIVALEKANTEFGLGFDSQDMVYYAKIFKDRNPTNVELFDLAQSNSEHSRHWFFKGRLVVDGTEDPQSLFDIVIDTQIQSNKNSVIAFSDNSSAIEGCSVSMLSAQCPYKASPLSYHTVLRHPTLTAETHNFPTGVSPFQGATTGTGGRLRDGQSTGKGSHVIAGSAGYCFGNLNIPGASRGYEDPMFSYPSNFASPLSIAIEASNGASDYGNKFGEPVITGFVRSFGEVVGGERREWVKPIMFSGGIGAIEGHLIKKDKPAPGMKLVKIGGPAYRIGVGGGAASSIEVQGTQDQSIDYNAVQRGDPEMGQKLNRVVRGCCELLDNPIQSIHDQGAGGNGNVLKELCEPTGGIVHCSKFSVGDNTLSALELWGAEYQESNALLTWDPDVISKIGSRESCYVDVVGEIVGNGNNSQEQ